MIHMPVGFCFMAYNSIALNAFKETVPGQSPESIVADFEKTERRAIYNVFPNFGWFHGCHFHYSYTVSLAPL